jgi:hypothetical protein
MLFITGKTSTIGSVDDGSTITDFMDIERERGTYVYNDSGSGIFQTKKKRLGAQKTSFSSSKMAFHWSHPHSPFRHNNSISGSFYVLGWS